jgi:hypothetical protein
MPGLTNGAFNVVFRGGSVTLYDFASYIERKQSDEFLWL